MKLYKCSKCNNPLYFENTTCLKCSSPLGFDPQILELRTLQVGKTSGTFSDLKDPKKSYRYCSNEQYGVCNWLVPHDAKEDLCTACVLNRTIPPLTEENLVLWRRIERAKHRLVYSLLRLRLPVLPKENDEGPGLAFDFLTTLNPEEKIMTGHYEGLITLNIQEADETQRVMNKEHLGERYRTLLGHFRHEIGHYYWDLRLKDNPDLTHFRELFGDDSLSYEEALKRYYELGAPPNWMDQFISPYASSHPWEDWAESWSHYLHMMDTLETAYYFGITVHPIRTDTEVMNADINKDPYTLKDFAAVFEMWLPITFAINSLSRSMGHSDFYPFVIPPPVIAKMKFIHNLRKTI